ncbi:putative bifunctional diguanylate cyclase/phosphodiesterase [Pseudomonas xionganensis]|uniref:putative bifunctional diguanylate cyclase/phosphodiesterase n=1 Tax=Pseudomonas xionganensis TaxID=2654845 RepID=UPI001C49892E|nr:EAL domain-containing protein [Pseudomonas xionganensis]
MSQTADDELFSFDDEGRAEHDDRAQEGWYVLIVDDDQDVHQSTCFAMANTQILGRPLKFLHAYSASEAIDLLAKQAHVAVILLDVVMESEHAGLHLVRRIRKELDNSETRIILRTGQPGYAPELEAIRDYDINDYKTKSELTRNRLYTALTTAIRSYDQIHTINASRRGLGMVIRASSQLLARQGVSEFAAGIITQICGLLGLPPEGLVCAYDHEASPASALIVAAAGNLTGCIDKQLGELQDRRVAEALKQALAERSSLFTDSSTTLFFPGQGHNHMAAYLQTERPLGELDKQLLEVFCSNIIVTLDNVLLLSQLKDHAYNDQLLHIPNRLGLVHALDQALGGDAASQYTLALIDIDGFSAFNDTLGHKLGDAMLQALSTRLQTKLPSSSLIARVDGDVFAILADHGTLEPTRLQDLLQDPLQFADLCQHFTATIGLTRLDQVDGKGSDALKAASIALKHGKQQQRGSISHFSREMEFETRARVQLLQDLRLAFERERLFVAYQPQYNLQNNQLVGLEALLRWRTEDNRYVSPAEFIPLAESSGLIVALGEWVLRVACHDLNAINQHSKRPLRMAVNVSVAQLRHPNFISMLSSALRESSVPANLIELEITESMAMLEADLMSVLIEQIKAQGLTLAVDDFGTGFSSLSYLESLNVDRLKIDLSFVRQLEQSEGSKRIVETIIQLAHNLDLDVIAEGIEQQSQATLLKEMGCHEGQGYLFAKPMSITELLAFIAAHPSE